MENLYEGSGPNGSLFQSNTSHSILFKNSPTKYLYILEQEGSFSGFANASVQPSKELPVPQAGEECGL